jgi:transposase
MHAYSLDLRQRIVKALNDGQSQKEVAQRFAVSTASVCRYRQHATQRPSLAAKRPPGAKHKLAEHVRQQLAIRLQEQPDATIAQHHVWLRDTHQVIVSVSTVHRVMQRLGFTYKKSLLPPVSAMKQSAVSGEKRSRQWQSNISSS